MKPTHRPSQRAAGSRRAAGFSLVEITLALGIVAFGLVGIVGVLPTAMSSSRQSVDKGRAVAIANTLYASFRSQPFNRVAYIDSQFDTSGVPLTSPAVAPLDLNALTKTSSTVTCYAAFLDVSDNVAVTSDAFGTQRRLRFTQASAGGAEYRVDMNFNNAPDGMQITNPQPAASNGQPTVPAQANQIELVISATSRPKDQYRFVSIVSNRTN